MSSNSELEYSYKPKKKKKKKKMKEKCFEKDIASEGGQTHKADSSNNFSTQIVVLNDKKHKRRKEVESHSFHENSEEQSEIHFCEKISEADSKVKQHKKKRKHSKTKDESFASNNTQTNISCSPGLEIMVNKSKRIRNTVHSESRNDDGSCNSSASTVFSENEVKKVKKLKHEKGHKYSKDQETDSAVKQEYSENMMNNSVKAEKTIGNISIDSQVESYSDVQTASVRNDKQEANSSGDTQEIKSTTKNVVESCKMDHKISIDDICEDDIEELIDSSMMNNDIAPEMIMRLSELQIPLTFPVPESHQIETYISHEPTQKQQDRFKNLDITMKKGKFNPDEDAVIKKNWERFSKEFHFDDPRPFILMSYNWKKYMKHEERINFVQYLGRGLPNRYLHGIYRRFKILFTPRKVVNTRYEERVDKIILECKARGIKDPFSKLASVTGRNRHSLYKRHCILQRKKNFKGKEHIEWTKDIAETVVQNLMKICEITDIEELRGQTISWGTWKLVAEECDCHAEAVKAFWDKKLSTQIFATKPIFQREILSEIVEKLIRLEVKHWQDVNWQELSKDFYGASPLFLFRRISRFKERVPKEKWATLRDYLLYLQANMSKLRIPSAVLQRYSVGEDGTLTLIDDTGEFILDSDSDSD